MLRRQLIPQSTLKGSAEKYSFKIFTISNIRSHTGAEIECRTFDDYTFYVIENDTVPVISTQNKTR